MRTICPLFFPLTRVKKSLFWISARQFMTMCRCILSKASPESTAAEIYLASADELLNGVETYASARGYYTYIYNPGRAGWQTVALIGPEIGEEEPEPELLCRNTMPAGRHLPDVPAAV